MVTAMAIALCQLGLAQGSVAVEKPLIVTVQKTVTSLPKVTQINIEGLKKLLKPNGKPLLVNFWATWCDPCREEFPDLVKMSAEFQGKVDFITVSLDDLADINTYVPKFLQEMNSNIPAYLLHTSNEAEQLGMIFKDWKGNLPLTVLFDSRGNIAYSRNGKLRHEAVTGEINKLLTPATTVKGESVVMRETPIVGLRSFIVTFDEGVADAKRDIALGEYKIIRYGMTPGFSPNEKFDQLLKKYSVTISDRGCMVSQGFPEYARGYNETSKAAFQKKFGKAVASKLGFVE